MVTADEAVTMLRDHLATAPGPPILLLGALSDAYPSVERDYGITRAIIAELVDAGVPFTVVTKSDIILRDLDLLVAHGERAHAQISICSVDDDVLRRLDPGAPSGTDRFGVIEELHRAGVRVDLNLLPWTPGISDTEALIERVPDGVEVVIGPLAFGLDTDNRRMLDRTYTRDKVWAAYMDEYARLGHHPNTSWIEPSLPPEENNPMYRLPVLESPLAGQGAV
jgi:DNA repair photolyase